MVEGRSLGLRASEPTFYFDNQSSNPAEVYNFSVQFFVVKNKRGRGRSIFKKLGRQNEVCLFNELTNFKKSF